MGVSVNQAISWAKSPFAMERVRLTVIDPFRQVVADYRGKKCKHAILIIVNSGHMHVVSASKMGRTTWQGQKDNIRMPHVKDGTAGVVDPKEVLQLDVAKYEGELQRMCKHVVYCFM